MSTKLSQIAQAQDIYDSARARTKAEILIEKLGELKPGPNYEADRLHLLRQLQAEGTRDRLRQLGASSASGSSERLKAERAIEREKLLKQLFDIKSTDPNGYSAFTPPDEAA